MKEFTDNIRLLLAALGHRLLEPISPPQGMTEVVTTRPDESSEVATLFPTAARENALLSLATGRARATGLRTYEGFVVLKGSRAAPNTKPNLLPHYKRPKDQLINDKIIVSADGGFEFSRDCLFGSPTEAAAVLTGNNISGPLHWKTESGVPLKNIEKQLSESLPTRGNR